MMPSGRPWPWRRRACDAVRDHPGCGRAGSDGTGRPGVRGIGTERGREGELRKLTFSFSLAYRAVPLQISGIKQGGVRNPV